MNGQRMLQQFKLVQQIARGYREANVSKNIQTRLRANASSFKVTLRSYRYPATLTSWDVWVQRYLSQHTVTFKKFAPFYVTDRILQNRESRKVPSMYDFSKAE